MNAAETRRACHDQMLNIADNYERIGDTDAAEQCRGIAEKLAPKPEWADGTVAWVTSSGDDDGVLWSHRGLFIRECGEWVSGLGNLADPFVVKVEPLRVLADDEVAIKRTDDICTETIEVLIDGLAHCTNRTHCITRDVLSLIRDALAAEAGAQ